MMRITPVGFLLSLTVSLLLAGCGGTDGPGGDSSLSPGAASYDLGAVRSQLDSLATPAGVEDALFQELKESLWHSLLQDSARSALSAPSSQLSAVTDFSIQPGDGSSAELVWTYANQGDYDQNGEVNVADLTPIALNFGASSFSPDWGNRSVADGDGNGEVNLADITPIATNFTNTVGGYWLQSNLDEANQLGWLQVTTIPFDSSEIPAGLTRRQFDYTLQTAEGGHYYRVVPFHNNEGGIPGNSDLLVLNSIPGSPQDLLATEGTVLGAVELSWSALEGAAFYEVERRTGQQGMFGLVGSPLPGVTEYTDSDVVEGEVYQYRVIGKTVFKESGYSDIVSGWPMRIPKTPLNLEASDGISATQVDLSWDASPEAAEFVIYRSEVSGSGHVELDRTASNSYSDTTATTDFIYYYQVSAANAAGESAAGNEDPGWLDGYLFPPVIESVSPLEGDEGAEVQFAVVTSGGAVENYSWVFGGGANPGTATEMSPGVTLGESGTFSASVTVSNARGEDTFDFQLTVNTLAWVHTFGTAGNEFCHGAGIDAEGNTYLAGRLDLDRTLYAVKYNRAGGLEWSYSFDPGVWPTGFDSAVDSQGNFYIGSASEFPSEQGVAITRFDTDGNLVSQRIWADSISYRVLLGVDGSDNLYICADAPDAGGLDFNNAVFKQDQAGSSIWMRYAKHNGSDGGTGHDGSLSGFYVDGAGNCYIQHFEARFLKIDGSGDGQWMKTWDTGSHDHPYSMTVDDDGNFYFGGGGGPVYLPFIIKVNPAGLLLFQIGWEITGIDSGASGYDQLLIDSDNNLWGMISSDRIGGWTERYSHLMRFDLDGVKTGHWQYLNVASDPVLWHMQMDSTRNFYFTGYDNDAAGFWSVATSVPANPSGVLADEPFEVIPGTANWSPEPAVANVLTGVEDVGGGDYDLLVMRGNPDSMLP